MGLMGMTLMAWLIVRGMLTLAWWALLLVWLIVKGIGFVLVVLPYRAVQRRRAQAEYNALIVRVTAGPRDADARRIDGPA